LGIGLVNMTVRNESDPALALLSEHVEHENASIRSAAIIGLGLAYAGTRRQDVADLLLPSVSDTALSMELSAVAALSVGLIFTGSANGDVASTILQTMMERDEIALKEPFAKFLAVALGLLFLGRQEESEAILETLKVVEHPVSKQSEVFVTACSFAATGNVLKVQEMLHICNDHLGEGVDDRRCAIRGCSRTRACNALRVSRLERSSRNLPSKTKAITTDDDSK
jgi:26S proteasome regulatory subunit N1